MKDFANLTKIDSRHIQVVDPLMRFKIRQTNRKNIFIKKKYFNAAFNLKNFVYNLLDTLFETNTPRILGVGLRRLRLNMLK